MTSPTPPQLFPSRQQRTRTLDSLNDAESLGCSEIKQREEGERENEWLRAQKRDFRSC